MLAAESQGERAEAVPPAAGIISQPIIDVKPARANFELHENCSESVCLCVSACARAAAAAAAALTRGRAGERRGAGAGLGGRAPLLARAPRRAAQTPRGRPDTGQDALRRRAARPPSPAPRRAHASHQAENSPAAGRLRATAGCERRERLVPRRPATPLPPGPGACSRAGADFFSEQASEREIQIKTSTHLRESA